MSWGKVYETTNFGELIAEIHLGFNKALAFTSNIFIDSINILIDSINNRLNG
jgi:hypothetical protein